MFNSRYLIKFGPGAFVKMRKCNQIFMENIRPQKPCLRLLNIAVLPALQGQGIGRQLLEAMEEVAVGKGLPTLQLECEDPNPARRLYECFGFATDRTFSAGGVKWHVMTKELAGDN